MALTIRISSELKKGIASPLFRIPGLSFLGMEIGRGPINGGQWILNFESAASPRSTVLSPCEVGYLSCPVYFSARLRAIGMKHSLTVSSPDDPTTTATAQVTAQYELLGNALQPDLREHPKSLKLGAAVVSEIDQVLDGKKKYNESTFPKSGDAIILYDMLNQRHGSAGYQKSQYVFKYSRIASNRAVLAVGYNNVERTYSTDQMLAETGPPTGILNAVSEAAEKSLQPDIEATEISSGYKFGWLKQTPTVTNTANNKVQISGEFWLALWSTWIYELAT